MHFTLNSYLESADRKATGEVKYSVARQGGKRTTKPQAILWCVMTYVSNFSMLSYFLLLDPSRCPRRLRHTAYLQKSPKHIHHWDFGRALSSLILAKYISKASMLSKVPSLSSSSFVSSCAQPWPESQSQTNMSHVFSNESWMSLLKTQTPVWLWPRT